MTPTDADRRYHARRRKYRSVAASTSVYHRITPYLSIPVLSGPFGRLPPLFSGRPVDFSKPEELFGVSGRNAVRSGSPIYVDWEQKE